MKKQPKRTKEATTSLRPLQVSITIGQVGSDIELEAFDRAAIYLEQNADMAALAMERGDSQLQLHLQGVACIRSTSVQRVKGDMAKVLGWYDKPPAGASMCVKSLCGNGIHNFLGLVGYCLKDEGQPHHRLYLKNLNSEQIEEGRRRHIVHGAVHNKNRLEITPQNLLSCALQYHRFKVQKKMSCSLRAYARQMFQGGQYFPSLKWLMSKSVSIERAERVWKIAVYPEWTTLGDVEMALFGNAPSERYYSSSLTLDHIGPFRNPEGFGFCEGLFMSFLTSASNLENQLMPQTPFSGLEGGFNCKKEATLEIWRCKTKFYRETSSPLPHGGR